MNEEISMELGMIGLGRMGANMTERLVQAGHRVVVYDLDSAAVSRIAGFGAVGVASMEAFVRELRPPRAVWLMVPAGLPVEATVNTLSSLLERDDIIIDGGNSNYKDSIRRATALEPKGIHFVDAGTSGGVWGLREGDCLMIGGFQENLERGSPRFWWYAPSRGRGVGVGRTSARWERDISSRWCTMESNTA